MVAAESPAIARGRVRRALRGARTARGATQTEVARALDWSLSKVQRIESGEVSLSSTDLRALLEYFGIRDPDTVQRLVDDARVSRRQRWWTAPAYRQHLTPGTQQLLQFESEASAVRVYQPMLVPGLLQTEAYANWIFSFWNEELSEADRRVRLDVRMKRRGQVLDREDPPDYLLILDESVLHREIGGTQVMSDQLAALLELGRRPHVHIRIVPLREGGVIGLLGPFAILDLGDEDDAVLYRESQLQDDIAHAVHEVRRHRTIFERMWRLSFDEAASTRLITSHAAALLSSMDRSAQP